MEGQQAAMQDLAEQILRQVRAEIGQMQQAAAAATGNVAAEAARKAETAAIDAAVQAIAARPATARVKPPRPSKFGGRASEVFNFCHVMKLYLKASGIELETEEAVDIAATYLEASAMTWWRFHQQQVDANVEPVVATWTQFAELLMAKFRTVDEARAARDRLADLRQKGSLRDYAQRFQLLMLELPEMNEKDKLWHFFRGLKPQVKIHAELAHPETVREAIRAADVADATLFHSSRMHTNSTPRPRTDEPVPMELDMAQRRPAQAGAPRGQLICYRCGKPGHMKRNCRSAPLPENRRA